MKLTYDDGLHQYKLDGQTVPSVTQVIKEAGLSTFANLPEHILQEAAIKGKHIHKATELADLDMLDRDSLDPFYLAHLEQWEKFKLDYLFVPEFIELELFHPILKYAGRVDRVGMIRINGKSYRAIVDIKTGMKTKEVAIQLAGYAKLFNHDLPKAEQANIRVAIYLKPDSYKAETFTNKADENIFLSALNITNWKRSN